MRTRNSATPEEITALEEMIGKYTVSEIAIKLNKPRSTVAGRITRYHQMRAKQDPDYVIPEIVRSKPGPKPKEKPLKKEKTKKNIQITPKLLTKVRLHPLDKIPPGGCRWPIGDLHEPGFHFCGAPANPSGPYCQEHTMRAFTSAAKQLAAALGD